MTRAVDLRRSFGRVVARWLLTQGEVRLLLPDVGGPAEVVPGDPGPDALRRMSLLVVVEAGLSGLLGRTRAATWLRRPSAAFDGRSPLEAMAEDAVLIALARTVAGGLAAAPVCTAPTAAPPPR